MASTTPINTGLNQLWKPQTFDKTELGSMTSILRIMFSINGAKCKLEYPNIFNEEFFRDNDYAYISYHTTIR